MLHTKWYVMSISPDYLFVFILCSRPSKNGPVLCRLLEYWKTEHMKTLLRSNFDGQTLAFSSLFWLCADNILFILGGFHYVCNIHKHELVPCFQVVEWKQRLEEFEKRVQALDVLLMRLFVGPNKSVLCDIYAYLWDMKGVLGTCLAYVRWLGKSYIFYVYIFFYLCVCVKRD